LNKDKSIIKEIIYELTALNASYYIGRIWIGTAKRSSAV